MTDDNIVDIKSKKLNKKQPTKQTTKQAPPTHQTPDPKVEELYQLGLSFDKLVLEAATKGLTLFEIAGIMSHRLGEVVRVMPHKEYQIDLLLEILLKRAGINNG